MTKTVKADLKQVGSAPDSSKLIRGGAPWAPGADRKAACPGPTCPGDSHPNEVDNLTDLVLAAGAAANLNKQRILQSEYYRLAATGDAKAIKDLSRSARTRWISHQGSDIDAQFSYLGRALPLAGRSAEVEALEQHSVDYASGFSTPECHLIGVRKFVAKWARRMLLAPSAPLGLPDWPNTSACIERSLSRGGARGYVLEKSSEFPLEVEFPFDGEGAQLASDARMLAWSLAEYERSMNEGWEAFGRKFDIPPAKVACLSERGLKTRVVTVSPAHLQTLGHSVGARLRGGLRRTRCAYAPLVGATDEEICNELLGCESTLISTDLTRASDLLPLELVAAVVAGLEESGRLTALELRILRTLTGPQMLYYPHSGKYMESRRGALMGLPTTWSILSLIHLYWVDLGRRASRLSSHSARTRGLICGDDALLALNGAGASAYAQAVRECGGETSPGKHYESREGPVRRAVFLERLYEFEVVDGKLAGGVRAPVLPLKGLTARVLPRSFHDGRDIRCHSPGIRLVIVLDSLWSQSARLHAPIRSFIERRHPWLPGYAESVLHLVPGLPLRLGGYCFGDLSAATAVQLNESSRIQASGRSMVTSLRREIDPVWRQASQSSAEGLNYSIVCGEAIYYGPQPLDHYPPLPVPEEGTSWRFVEDDLREVKTTTLNYRQMVMLGMGPDSSNGAHALTLRPVDFQKCRQRILARSPDESEFPLGTRLSKPLTAWLIRRTDPSDRLVYGVSWLEVTHTSSHPLLLKFWEKTQLGGPSGAPS